MANDNAMPKSVYLEMMKCHPPVSGVFDLHHCLFTKRDVMGMPVKVRAKIHHPCNLLWENHDTHASHNGIPSRQEAYRLLCAREGQKTVDEYVSEMLSLYKYPPFTLESLQGE